MNHEVSFVKKCWRVLLRKYYAFEQSILSDPRKLERFKHFCAMLPIRNNKVVIDSYGGKGYGENAKYIVEELIRRSKKYKIIWLVNTPGQAFPKEVKPIVKYSLRAYYESATAKAWIFNKRDCRLVEKRRQQVYLQTWHGGIPMKKIEKDAEEKLPKGYTDAAKSDGQATDGILADGLYIESIYKRAFWLKEECEILRFGSPRADILCKTDSEMRKRVRSQLGISEDAYVVLYAPTFRNSGSTEAYIDDLEAVRDAFSFRHANVVMLVRLHPNVAKTASNLQYTFSDHLINVTDYSDPQELIVASDCAITDYSSIIYDFALMRKPGFLCMKDKDDYLSERGVYDLFFHQPFKMNYQESELIQGILSFDEAQYQKRLDLFFEEYPTYNDGNASKKTADWLIGKGLRC